MYCHTCYATFDSDQHKPAFVVSKEQTKEVQNICQACYDKTQSSGGVQKAGRLPRPPMDNGVKSFYLNQYANGLRGSAGEQTNPDSLVLRGLPSVYDHKNGGGIRSSSEDPSNRQSKRSINDEVQGNMKNIVGYQKKGLLEILDREGTHYN